MATSCAPESPSGHSAGNTAWGATWAIPSWPGNGCGRPESRGSAADTRRTALQAGRILPLRLARQPVTFARIYRKPLRISHCVLSRYIDHRTPSAPPAPIVMDLVDMSGTFRYILKRRPHPLPRHKSAGDTRATDHFEDRRLSTLRVREPAASVFSSYFLTKVRFSMPTSRQLRAKHAALQYFEPRFKMLVEERRKRPGAALRGSPSARSSM